MDIDQIADLIKLVNTSEIGEIIVEEGDAKITLRKHAGVTVETGRAATAQTDSEAPTDIGQIPQGVVEIKSPMVGTFYRSSSPDAPSYIEEGDDIEVGQTVCLLEAMKLFNEINAEVSGKIVKICVENAQPVEYGQTLFWVETH